MAAFAVTRALGDDPKAVGDQVFGIYLEALEKSNAQLAGAPEPTLDLGVQLDAIKETAVTDLVALGHKSEAMSPADRAVAERTVRLSLSGIQGDPVYKDYQAAWQAYAGSDPAFFDKIKSLNILTQYVFFDLLREQEPEEADRLGV